MDRDLEREMIESLREIRKKREMNGKEMERKEKEIDGEMQRDMDKKKMDGEREIDGEMDRYIPKEMDRKERCREI